LKYKVSKVIFKLNSYCGCNVIYVDMVTHKVTSLYTWITTNVVDGILNSDDEALITDAKMYGVSLHLPPDRASDPLPLPPSRTLGYGIPSLIIDL